MRRLYYTCSPLPFQLPGNFKHVEVVQHLKSTITVQGERKDGFSTASNVWTKRNVPSSGIEPGPSTPFADCEIPAATSLCANTSTRVYILSNITSMFSRLYFISWPTSYTRTNLCAAVASSSLALEGTVHFVEERGVYLGRQNFGQGAGTISRLV